MYSMLMMAAMAGSPDATAFGGRLFGGGCSGVVVSSCYGSCTGSACYGGSYYAACTGSYYSSGCGYSSCGGGGSIFGLRDRLGSLFHGCTGSSCGGYTAHYASCCGYSSCCGHAAHYSGCAGSSCCGGCYGLPYYSAYGGCYGSCSGFLPAYPVYGAPVYSAPVVGVPVMGAVAEPAVAGVPAASRTEVGTNGLLAAAPADAAAPARLAVELPAAAKLYVDGVLVPGTGESRQFHTPELARGKAYYYELKAELTVAGKTETEEKKVVVRAGDALTEAFPKLAAAATAARPAVVAAR